MVGKYPREFGNLNGFDAGLRARFWVSSSASAKPSSVTAKVVSLRWRGMVIGGIIIEGILGEMKNLAKMLLISRHLIELINK